MTGRRLTAEEKERIENLSAEGESVNKIGQRLARSPHTVAKYAAEPGAQERIATKLEGVAERSLDSISADDYKKASLLQKTTAAAIAVDKLRLIRGEATSIDVHVLWDVVAEIRAERAERNARGSLPTLPAVIEAPAE